MKTAIVITTIQSPTKSVRKFSKIQNHKMFVAGDNKTPLKWSLPNTDFISIKSQHKKFPKLSRLIAQNHYARKNFAYLEAIDSGAEYIFETDDDNFPNSYFPNFLRETAKVKQISGEGFVNIYSHFTKENVWPRGLPLNLIKARGKVGRSVRVRPLIQQALADLDPDVDAVYRLTDGRVIRFDNGKVFALSRGTYSPFNSQATLWHKDVFQLMYLPSTINSRVTDIWRGYIAQRILWELDSALIFLSPCVYQKRNIHNFMKDFTDELDLFTKTEEMVWEMDKMKLSGDIPTMMIKTYEELVKLGYFKKEEPQILKVWLKYFKRNE